MQVVYCAGRSCEISILEGNVLGIKILCIWKPGYHHPFEMFMNEEVALLHFAWPQSNPLPSHQVRIHRRLLHRQQPHNIVRKMLRFNLCSPTVRRNAPQRYGVLERHYFCLCKLWSPGNHMENRQCNEKV